MLSIGKEQIAVKELERNEIRENDSNSEYLGYLVNSLLSDVSFVWLE